MENNTGIAMKILQAMSEKNISYGELSIMTGIPKSALQRYATGTTGKIPLDRVEKIAVALGISAAYLMGWQDDIKIMPTDTGERDLSPKRKAALELIEKLSDDQIDAILKLIGE